jgi:hypothetical protein
MYLAAIIAAGHGAARAGAPSPPLRLLYKRRSSGTTSDWPAKCPANRVHGAVWGDSCRSSQEDSGRPRLRCKVLTCGDVASRYTRDVPGSALSSQFRWQIRIPSRHPTAEARSQAMPALRIRPNTFIMLLSVHGGRGHDTPGRSDTCSRRPSNHARIWLTIPTVRVLSCEAVGQATGSGVRTGRGSLQQPAACVYLARADFSGAREKRP